MMKLLLVCALLTVATAEQVKVTPVQKVIQLLQDMIKKGEG
jgi:hypothetical protein